MSEKAVGYDWKRQNIFTLRNSAGCNNNIQKNNITFNAIIDYNMLAMLREGILILLLSNAIKNDNKHSHSNVFF